MYSVIIVIIIIVCFLLEFIQKWENLTSVLQSSLSSLSETSTLSNKEEADDKEQA